MPPKKPQEKIPEWLELESDPGLFTLLVKDIGGSGMEVEEIYDLQAPFSTKVLGFIFLFQWTGKRRGRKKGQLVKDQKFIKSIFFAQQIVPNSCATHALLSIILNAPELHMSDRLKHFKELTKDMNPKERGLAIGNVPYLAEVHNSYATPQDVSTLSESYESTSELVFADTYHFVSFVPINGRLFELDGLNKYPIDHGPLIEGENWTEQFRKLINDRFQEAAKEEIRFNLMAVIPDKRIKISYYLEFLNLKRLFISLLFKLHELEELEKNNYVGQLATQCLNETLFFIPSTSTDFTEEKIYPESSDKDVVQKQSSSDGDSQCLKNSKDKIMSDTQRTTIIPSSGNNGDNQFLVSNIISMESLILYEESINNQIKLTQDALREESEKHKQYRKQNSHSLLNYDQYICIILALMSENGLLPSYLINHLKTIKYNNSQKKSD